VPQQRAMRSAVSAVILRFPWTISLMRRGGNPMATARVLGDAQLFQVFVHQYLSWMDPGQGRG